MQRYFLEVAYKGTNYSGFQVQHNANSIQSEVEKALAILFRQQINLTGSSRTDAGVHALQNFFHFNTEIDITEKNLYNLNSILPADIVAKAFHKVDNSSHCRFDAVSREYNYFVYNRKNPFLRETAYYFPYKLNFENLQEAAKLLTQYTDFTSFSKRKTQVKSFMCNIYNSEWLCEKDHTIYKVTANRFLRGMVRGFVGTMLKVATGSVTLEQLKHIIENRDCTRADFSVPSKGLFLVKVNYGENVLSQQIDNV
ncbi:MAG TPA: tRNA pseudouridine(38-40) synthase TruA [Chitinophagaceae bacterium]